MGKTKRIWRESQHPRDSRGRFARRGGEAWIKRAAAEIRSLAGEAGDATRAGGRPRISRNAKAGAVLQAHAQGGRPSAVRVPQATVTQRPSLANLADFNRQATAAVSAPEVPKKRTPRPAPGAAALIAARAAEQAPQMPAMVAARTAPETAPVPGAEAYAAMRRHTLVALARDAGVNIRGKSNTEIANDLAAHDAKVKADRQAKLNPSGIGQVDTPRDGSQDGAVNPTTPRKRIPMDAKREVIANAHRKAEQDAIPSDAELRSILGNAAPGSVQATDAKNELQSRKLGMSPSALPKRGDSPEKYDWNADMEERARVLAEQDAQRKAEQDAQKAAAPGADTEHLKRPKAKKGDLVVIETKSTRYISGEGSREVTSVHIGVVASVNRDGVVTSWSRNVSGSNPMKVTNRDKTFKLEAERVDVRAAIETAQANPWPHSPGNKGKPFDSLAEARAAVAPHLGDQTAKLKAERAEARGAAKRRPASQAKVTEAATALRQEKDYDKALRLIDEGEAADPGYKDVNGKGWDDFRTFVTAHRDRAAKEQAAKDAEAAKPKESADAKRAALTPPEAPTPAKKAAPRKMAAPAAPTEPQPTYRVRRDYASGSGLIQHQLIRQDPDGTETVINSGANEGKLIQQRRRLEAELGPAGSSEKLLKEQEKLRARLAASRERRAGKRSRGIPQAEQDIMERLADLEPRIARARREEREANERANPRGLGGMTGVDPEVVDRLVRRNLTQDGNRNNQQEEQAREAVANGTVPAAVVEAAMDLAGGVRESANRERVRQLIGLPELPPLEQRRVREIDASEVRFGDLVLNADGTFPVQITTITGTGGYGIGITGGRRMELSGRVRVVRPKADAAQVAAPARARISPDAKRAAVDKANADATAAKRAASLEKARTAQRDARRAELNRTKDPKDNAAKISALESGVLESADLYRTALAGPSGQRAAVHVGRVRYTPDRPEGEFEVTNTNGGDRAGWATRVQRNGETVYEVHSENYDGGRELLGWADSLAHAADVLNNGEAAASTGGTLDARRISGRMFERNPNRNKSIEELEREALDREIKQARESLANPNIGPQQRVSAEKRLARLEAERRGEPAPVDTPRDKSQNGGASNSPTTEATMARTAASTGTPQLGVTESSRGRTTTVTLPDGTTAQRTSKTMTYTHAVVATRDLHASARELRASIADRRRHLDAYRAWVAAGADRSQLIAARSASGSYNDQRAGLVNYAHYLPGFAPTETRTRQGNRDHRAAPGAFAVISSQRHRSGGPHTFSDYEGYEPQRQIADEEAQIARDEARAAELEAGPQHEHYVARWSQRADTAFAAIGSPEVNAPHTRYQVVGVGGVARQEGRPAKVVPTAAEKAAAAQAKKDAEKAAAAQRRQDFFDKTINGIAAALEAPGNEGRDNPQWHLHSITEQALISLAKHLKVKVPNREQGPFGARQRTPEQVAAIRRSIIDAIRERQGKA